VNTFHRVRIIRFQHVVVRMCPDLLNCHKIVKCGAPRGLIPTVLLEPGTLLGSR
jgi:hypothetical protein